MADRRAMKFTDMARAAGGDRRQIDLSTEFVFEKAAGDRRLYAIASTEAVDRVGDVILQDGWELEPFRANPVILRQHDHSRPVARAENVRVAGDELRMTIVFPPPGGSTDADEAWNLVKAGVLRALSVGFMPLETRPRPNSNGGLTIVRAELWEVSLVAVPANPQALVIDHTDAKAAISERDPEDLERELEIQALVDRAEALDREAEIDALPRPPSPELHEIRGLPRQPPGPVRPGEMEFVGIASSGRMTTNGEYVSPGGWSLNEFRANPVLLLDHDKSRTVGRVTEVWTIRGKLQARFVVDDPAVRRRVQDSDLGALSVGYVPGEPQRAGLGTRYGSAVLTEISLCSQGADPGARIDRRGRLERDHREVAAVLARYGPPRRCGGY